MDQATRGSVPEDEQLERFGYRQQFARSLRHFESFAVAQYYVLGALGVGLVFYIVQLVTEREAMRREPGQE